MHADLAVHPVKACFSCVPEASSGNLWMIQTSSKTLVDLLMHRAIAVFATSDRACQVFQSVHLVILYDILK